MDKLLILAAAPAAIILFYIYIRDKYEKEPLLLLTVSLLYGFLFSVPIVFSEHLLLTFAPPENTLSRAFFDSFAVAAFVEESFKLTILFLLVNRSKSYNEPFDAVVYAVFVSLGFAAIENILYVINPKYGGIETGIARAVLAVPAHGLFAVGMGYYFSFAKFKYKNKLYYIAAFAVAFFYHGIYDFALLCNLKYSFCAFILFVIFLWLQGFYKMHRLLELSPFKKP